MLRNFFETHVNPSVSEWHASPLDQRLANNAVSALNNMAARAYQHWKAHDTNRLHGAVSEGAYRNELAARECADFGLIRDIADAHKHVVLNRPNRRVTRHDQTALREMAFGQELIGENVFCGVPDLVVTLDDRSKRPLIAIVANVVDMWERLLHEWRL